MVARVITATNIKAALKANKPVKLYDGMNLILDVRSATSASWVFRWTEAGVSDEAALGSLFKMTKVGDDFDLKPIRDLRDRCLQIVAAKGNPKLVLRAEKR